MQTEAELARREGRDYEPADQLLARILKERRKQWEDEQRARGKDPAKITYKEPQPPDTEGLPELPEGWCWATPEQLSSYKEYSLAIGPFGSNLKVSDYQEYGVPLVFVRNIRTSIFINSGTHYISDEKAKSLTQHKVVGGDVLITKMGEPPGDACLYPTSSLDGVITADCIKWSISDVISEKSYFVHITNSPIIKKQVLIITRGVAQKKMSLGRFKSIAYPLPPKDEQERIVLELEELSTTVIELEQMVRKSQERSRNLRKRILRKAFDGRIITQGN